MWNVQPVIFEEENEEALKAEFVRLSALYPERDCFEIARYVFRNSRDPQMRADQAGMIWANDLEIKERIRVAKLKGPNSNTPETVEELQIRIIATTENENLDYREKKVMIEGYMAFAQTKGWVVKSIEKRTESTRRLSAPIHAVYDD